MAQSVNSFKRTIAWSRGTSCSTSAASSYTKTTWRSKAFLRSLAWSSPFLRSNRLRNEKSVPRRCLRARTRLSRRTTISFMSWKSHLSRAISRSLSSSKTSISKVKTSSKINSQCRKKVRKAICICVREAKQTQRRKWAFYSPMCIAKLSKHG